MASSSALTTILYPPIRPLRLSTLPATLPTLLSCKLTFETSVTTRPPPESHSSFSLRPTSPTSKLPLSVPEPMASR
ncbi:unnamed protein product [Thlaspi arvense]|uniref:Uncharacterized protein n=1 Tax=Thlaspi arvense TaxID=13288 RepID=A0AAU9T7Z0_THLAR|nr:unnamed protein product [Thlaspi arvense]